MSKKDLLAIKNVYHHLLMERASFCKPGASPFGPEADQFTADVKESTRIWRDSWLFPQLARVIKKYDPTWEPAAPHHLS